MTAPSPVSFTYLRDPDAIYARSFEMIDEAVDLTVFATDIRPVVRRVVHACGQGEAAAAFQASNDFASVAKTALANGATIVADCRMVAAGIMQRLLQPATEVLIALDAPRTDWLAKDQRTTRSAAAMDALAERLDGAVVVIGNAPTALFRLLELAHAGTVLPAAIIGMPVGFVGAAESKAQLAESAAELKLAFATVHGRMGGSAMAAAALNALLVEQGG